MFNGMIDLSHHNAIADWAAVKASGVVAVVHKATEGATYRDPLYAARRIEAKSHGLLWGSYHFSSGVAVADQVANYLAYADPRPDELVCLDFEESTAGQDMDLDDMVGFATGVRAAIGRLPVIYGGRRLREATAGIEASILSDCPLWYARFADRPYEVPALWKDWTFWQYTDGAAGPEPHEVPGIGRVDRDLFNGTKDAFLAGWPF
ncbi:glycoside hydrolase family 25 protein [Hansschlegelia sp. KR7-227]|uniref:glycoside hydrolase family 25 protein n=1 Tax=Hansschlegelia sp. KR7-227 TaxID=3400914 RepID=UPI003C0DE178